MEFTLLWMLFILIGFRVRYAATPQPDLRDLTPGQTNPILLFAINTMIWGLICFAQWSFHFLLYDRFYRHKLLHYIDLLSIANVSLLILDERCHGYYIHGRSCHPSADTDMAELNGNLKREESDMVPRRGLNDTDQQSFEIFVAKNFRETYDKIYRLIIGEEQRRLGHVERLNRLTTLSNQRGRPKPASDASVKAYGTINRFLCSFFEKHMKEFQYVIKEKTYLERFFGATPEVNQGSVFYHDETAFSRATLYGIEWKLLMLYILLYNLVDVATDNPFSATLAAYCCDLFVVFVRGHFGEMNISAKTLLDP
ncbi:Meckelin, partial [Quaeritorhiza haematococci]